MKTKTLIAGVLILTGGSAATIVIGTAAPARPPAKQDGAYAPTVELDGNIFADRVQRRAPTVSTEKTPASVGKPLSSLGWGAYVVNAKSCLNLRTEPTLAGALKGCEANGGMLMSDGRRVLNDGVIWLHVERGHDNNWFWAAQVYLEREGTCGG